MADQSKAYNLLYHLKKIGEITYSSAGTELMVSGVQPYWFTVKAEADESGQVLLSTILPMYGGNGPKAEEMFVDATRCALASLIAKKYDVKYVNTGHSYHQFRLYGANEESASNLTKAIREWNLLESDPRIKNIAAVGEKSLEALVSILL